MPSPPPTDTSSPPDPPPVPVETHPYRTSFSSALSPSRLPDPTRLAPEDAYFAPMVRSRTDASYDESHSLAVLNGGAAAAFGGGGAARKDLRKVGGGRRRKRKGAWKKLLWVRQSYPDNYTDTETFLDHLQRNPRVRPYDFWPLVADSTVIVQHVCSVAIFVCCFVGIVQGRLSPVSVVCWGSVVTGMGWVLWDMWVLRAHGEAAAEEERAAETADDGSSSSSLASRDAVVHGLGLAMSGESSGLHRQGNGNGNEISGDSSDPGSSSSPSPPPQPSYGSGPWPATSGELSKSRILTSRNRQRLSTLKSAFLIYFALLGLSPILKSLTKSTASDSIWAMSCWLLIINIFSFDYGSGEGAGATKFPASLSTNTAVMASTVLASRLPSTPHVFSLMLFSIEVFGLFPIFRRQLRHISWTGHVLLTLALVIVAGGAVGVTLRGGVFAAVVGSVLGSVLTALAMGGCSWWLLSLQKYKNVVTGPWDPARPIIRRHWELS
ncbi:phosphatidylinositol N-acetylglucosaminyltransferase-domain-containing protein [Aspergillus taichungensis]|uniref:Phosphatidylinositol N-acetylglucosaminyltransferase-domain-containing protein n=1 Tax=Aspergillus taichungensis TaxID=482145 RepID=A0A2J5HYZ0_9EURO|nr:phosphatidylinositol N-acetylglucosaminyltransferase-domain-containing protein [Aspergillus taichungensis]